LVCEIATGVGTGKRSHSPPRGMKTRYDRCFGYTGQGIVTEKLRFTRYFSFEYSSLNLKMQYINASLKLRYRSCQERN
jgi:hypothetical protein